MTDPTNETNVTTETTGAPVRLSDDDVAFLLMILRNSSRPLTTSKLVDAFREQSGRE